MPTQKKEFVFDKNEFLKDMVNNSTMGDYIDKVVTAMYNPHYRDHNGHVSGYNGPETDEELESSIQNSPYRAYITKSLYEMYKNPDGQTAQDTKACWQFVGPIFTTNPTEQDFLIVLKKIDVFNQEVQAQILRHIFKKLYSYHQSISQEKSRAIRKEAAVKLATMPNATLEDMCNAAAMTSDMNIIRDTIEMAKRELDKEMKKDFPDKEKISKICSYARLAVVQIGTGNKQYVEMVTSEFDSNKVLESGAKYVPQLQKSLEERAVDAEYEQFKINTELEKQKKETDKANQETARAQQETTFVQQELENEKQKNAKLTKQLNEMQKALQERDALIKSIKMKIASQKVGLIGGGPLKEIQEYVKEATKQY